MKFKLFKDWPVFVKLIALSVIAITPLILIILFFVNPSIEDKLYEYKYQSTKGHGHPRENWDPFVFQKNSIPILRYPKAKLVQL